MRTDAYDGVRAPVHRSLPAEVPELRLGLAVLAVAAAAAVCARTGAGVTAGLVVMAAVGAVGSLVLPVRLAGVAGLSAWAFLTGFVVHVGGRLTLHQADLARLGLLLAATVLASISAHVHVWATRPVGLGDAQHLAGHRRDLPDAEEEEAQQLRDRVALGPLEVDVRDDPGAVPRVQQEGGQRVGDRG